MASTAEKPKLSPAYASHKSFNSFFDARREDGHVTTVVDRSLMSNFAGSTKGELLATLKFLGMIDDKGTPSKRYEEYVVADDEARKELLEAMVRNAYAFLFEAPGFYIERATSNQVADLFRNQGINGSTLVRAVAFFLAAAKQAGIKVSPNIKPPPMAARGASKPKKEVPPPPPLVHTIAPPREAPPTDVENFDIPIPIGRKVTVSIPANFTSGDWDLFQTMLTPYVEAWKAQIAARKTSKAEVGVQPGDKP
ncbi:DUF5343 domain-containing protein [Variovorax paradoxus]|nr:DUF5343 domain-containing protein [Variovorax paradoxus]MBT2304711.1 DUF5343 domain-containing protein [Variovorax paradoxus]